MKIIHKFSSWVILVLGLGHIAATPAFYPGFTAKALWFAGTGLGLVFLGLFNLATTQLANKAGGNLCIIANFLACAYGAIIPLLVPEPQAFLAEIAFVGALVGAFFLRRNTT